MKVGAEVTPIAQSWALAATSYAPFAFLFFGTSRGVFVAVKKMKNESRGSEGSSSNHNNKYRWFLATLVIPAMFYGETWSSSRKELKKEVSGRTKCSNSSGKESFVRRCLVLEF